jgi:hypothetical protein
MASPFYARRLYAVVPNVSWGLIPWEADILACTKAGFLHEIEVKVSMSDWKADLLKDKFKGAAHSKWIKNFWYAGPPKLMARFGEIAIPETAGVIAVDDSGVKVLRAAKANKAAKRLSAPEILQLCRLGAIKAWRRHKPLPEQTDFIGQLVDVPGLKDGGVNE